MSCDIMCVVSRITGKRREKMRNFTISVVVVGLILGGISMATSQTLTSNQIHSAIERGLKSKPSEIGLAFKVSEFNNAKAFTRSAFKRFRSHGLESQHGLEEFGLAVYTPLAWIERATAIAASQLRPFSTNDVTDDMRRPILRIFVKPNAQHIVLRDTNKQSTLQSIDGKRPFLEAINFGPQWEADIVGNIILFEFPLEEVRKLQIPGNGSFYIRVEVTPGQFEQFEVKKKHLDRLPL